MIIHVQIISNPQRRYQSLINEFNRIIPGVSATASGLKLRCLPLQPRLYANVHDNKEFFAHALSNLEPSRRPCMEIIIKALASLAPTYSRNRNQDSTRLRTSINAYLLMRRLGSFENSQHHQCWITHQKALVTGARLVTGAGATSSAVRKGIQAAANDARKLMPNVLWAPR